MMFKDISYLELFRPSCSVEQNFLAIVPEGFMMSISMKLFFRPVVQEMSLK